MFKNYLKISLRNIKKHKGYSFINIFGLAVGMACCLLVFLWVQDEFRYDRFHENRDRLYQVYSELHYSDGRRSINMGSYYPLARVLKEECPGVSEALRYHVTQSVLIKNGEKRFSDNNIGLADRSFFELFSFPFVKGNPETALSDRFSIVITEEMGRRFFGEEDPMGRTLNVDHQFDFLVTGIIEDVPYHSSLRFDCIIPFVWIFGTSGEELDHWGGNPLTTFVLLHENTNIGEVAQKITRIVEKYDPVEMGQKTHFHLHPMTRMHLYSPEGDGLIRSITIFSIIAFFVLIIACINFMNLSTARAATRVVEVGLRKVVGARRIDLIRQFIGESILLSFMTLVISVLLVSLFLPVFNDLLAQKLSMKLLTNPVIVLSFIGIALFTGILSGSYPALFLSAFQPANVVKGTTRYGARSTVFRKILVVGQFTLSLFLVIATMAVYKQLDFIKNKDLGFDKDNLLNIYMRGGVRNNYESVKNEFMQNPNILNVTRSVQNPAYIGSSVNAVDWEGKDPQESVSMNWDIVDYDYIETFRMELLEGRTFSKEFSADTDETYIVNEEAVKLMGMNSPVGKPLSVFGNEGKIIGVVKDFHFQPLRFVIQPFVLMMNPNWSKNFMYVRIRLENASETIEYIESVCEKFDRDYPVVVHFFRDTVMRWNYQTEQQMVKMCGYFTSLAIFISCLGLFGLASFITEQRTKEIGIRKVMGASISDITLMLSREFVRWVLMANIIALPVAYYAISKWLENFAYRVNIEIWIFALSTLIALLIAFLTTSYQSIKAALANPVESLRYE